MTCSVDGCPGKSVTRGWCRKHYTRWLRHGDPLAYRPGYVGRGRVSRWRETFLGLIRQIDGGCHEFTGRLDADGYGKAWDGERQVRAHRLAYRLFVGPIPEGHTVDHVCHNEDPSCPGGSTCAHRRCVNPEHLRAVPIGVNVLASPNTPAAKNAAKTHCRLGHPFTSENTRIDKDGSRNCRKCHARRQRERRARVASA